MGGGERASRCCKQKVVLRLTGQAEVKVKREEEGGSRQGEGKVCFGFLLLDHPRSADYAQGQRCSQETRETPVHFILTFPEILL